jgi:hypothetical protein
MKGVFTKKFCWETRQGRLVIAPKLNSQENSRAGLIKNNEFGFYRFSEYVRIRCQNNDCQFRQMLSISDILPQVVKLTIENSECYCTPPRFQ